MSYITFCTLELLSPKHLTHMQHILNVEKGKRPQNVERASSKGESCEDSCSGQVLAQLNKQIAECLIFFCF